MMLVPRRFTELRATQPQLSDTALLNSNNRAGFTGDVDVVVVGAGIIGLFYAIQLKTIFPEVKITVFEKSAAPVQKIGESTLSSLSRFTRSTIMPHDYMLRLFALKDGLQFYCIDEDGNSVISEDVGGLDISFQFDRRMSELLLTMWAQGMGIIVYHGVDVELAVRKDQQPTEINPFNAPGVQLKVTPYTTESTVRTKLVCDATGFSRKLTSKFGVREQFDGWNCNAYWAYFREKNIAKAEDRLSHWDYPATKHICFPEGWGWFIKLISWHKSPLANLMDLVAYTIDNVKRGVSAEEFPCTNELSKLFKCPYEYITSIGWAVRDDHQFPDDLTPFGKTEGEQKFTYFKRKYPTLNHLMDDVYELLPGYYGNRTYFVRKSMAYRSPIVAGDGWFAIGNSAGFTNPLISPGINAGIGTAVLAATLSKTILSAPMELARAAMDKSAAAYQEYSHEFMMPRLWLMNQFWYTMFRDHKLFEALLRCFWALGVDEIDTRYLGGFTQEDLKWLVGAGGDPFQHFADKVLSAVDPNSIGPPSKESVEEVWALSRECLARRHQQFPQNKWGRYIRKYDDRLQRVPGKKERDPDGNCYSFRCRSCRTAIHNTAPACPVCGTRGGPNVEISGTLAGFLGMVQPLVAFVSVFLIALLFAVGMTECAIAYATCSQVGWLRRQVPGHTV